ncbi:protein kinase [Alkaliphilus metalliredigens QYMF]|uniref:non-specific serine/threonine protein kinase n=1 Tax=Alkaliphilus metalliredigens (strain QYMF) TaxID=293826 RepID=A6TRW1_ALKMQ|nr:Stk1 family PASTA domain-containing Ser/Thr kinase [Alkaliphilus metalliredigens]ABR48929.1 protein kinase [Alkaliphilus metalliredigens QYMF]
MIGKTLGNRYEIIEKVGGGGMALVYKAKCTLLNRHVAVKVLRSEFTNDKDFIEKFKQESQAAASLSHPNIVNIYDVGQEDEIYYIVMEYVDGMTLKQLINEKGILNLREIINYTKQIANALQHAHQNHIIHRDIKPHNILMTKDNRAKVTDFGIALAATTSTITNAGSVIGSVHYFSPEQARGGYTDEKSDFYALGIVMYEMITGVVPFEGDSPITVALKQIQEKPAAPSTVNPDIPKGLENIILKLIEKEQSLRYGSAELLINDLDKLSRDPETIIYRDEDEEQDCPTQVIPMIKTEESSRNNIKNQTGGRVKKSKGPKKLVVAAAVLAAFIMAIVVTVGLFYAGDIFRNEDVKVPDFEGKEIGLVRDEVKELGLELTEDMRRSTEVAVGHVIQQNPSKGMTVRKGYTVKVTVSSGAEEVEVPDLFHEDVVDALLILEEQNLVSGDVLYDFSDLPIGTIMIQSPLPGARVKQGSAVNYTLSKGPEKMTYTMPKVVGEPLEVAKGIIRQTGLQVGTEDEDFSEQYEKGIVIRQSVPAETEVEENTIVNLVVSKGAEVIEPEEEDPVDVEPEETASTKTIEINLRNYTNMVTVEIRQLINGGEESIYFKEHNIAEEGSQLYVPIRESGTHRFQVYIDDEKQGAIIEIDF